MPFTNTLERTAIDAVPAWVPHLAATFAGAGRSVRLRDRDCRVLFQQGSHLPAGALVFELLDLHDRPVGSLEVATSE